MTSPQNLDTSPSGPCALVIAHPGHELRVYGWMCLAHPVAFVLTDGSGHSGVSRIGSTERILRETGATLGRICSPLTDRAAYSALLEKDFDVFIRLANRIAGEFVALGLRYVVADSVEGYNPVHDVCRLIVNTAVAIASASDAKIANLEFAVVGEARGSADENRLAVDIHLNDEMLERKLNAVRSYRELKEDADEYLRKFGPASLRFERLFLSSAPEPEPWPGGEVPLYESLGRERVAAGRYRSVITYKEHVRPLAQALAEHLGKIR